MKQMKYFHRLARVVVSPDIDVREHRIRFDITKSVEPEKNNARVEVYNLSPNTRSRIQRNGLVKILAGYQNNLGYEEVGQGNVTDVSHVMNIPDIVTTIYVKDGVKATRGKNISLSFDDKASLSHVINAISSKLGISIKYSNFENKSIKGGYSFAGNATEALDDLAKQYNFTWSIQNGLLQILSKKKRTTGKTVVYLTSESGLIKSPEKKLKTTEEMLAEPDIWVVKSLLQPKMEAGDYVKITSKTLNGQFVIKQLKHSADTHGEEWETEIEVQRG